MQINKKVAISDSGFIFDPISGDSYSANEIGRDIIIQIKSGSSMDEVIKSIEAKYDVDKVTIQKDLADFLYILKSYHIIQDDEA